MTHLLQVNGYYHYNRRVPESLQPIIGRKLVRVSLSTGCKRLAQEKAIVVNQQTEDYWRELSKGHIMYDRSRYRSIVKVAKNYGYEYKPMSAIAQLPILELIERVLAVKEGNAHQVAAVLGAQSEKDYPLSLILEKFWVITENQLYNKSANAIRKWKNPRKRAIKNLIKVISDKDVSTITRDDMLKFQRWWIERMVKHSMSVDSPNKDFINIKVIIETVVKHEKLTIDINHLFADLLVKTRKKTTRPPFTTEQILTIINNPIMQNMNGEAYAVFLVCAETGARPSEVVGLRPEDIRLDADIPHIVIVDREMRDLKTVDSNRSIPLTGYALEAFRQWPNGFPSYYDRCPDNLTNAVNKFMLENKLRPTPRHTMYSLRHSFQDRLTERNCPDRIQTQLMGHSFESAFERTKYGEGASLKEIYRWMKKVVIK